MKIRKNIELVIIIKKKGTGLVEEGFEARWSRKERVHRKKKKEAETTNEGRHRGLKHRTREIRAKRGSAIGGIGRNLRAKRGEGGGKSKSLGSRTSPEA